jgi:hypothetical protein
MLIFRVRGGVSLEVDLWTWATGWAPYGLEEERRREEKEG